MRSLIILEVEHGDTTDELEDIIFPALVAARRAGTVLDWSVRMDVPPYITAVSLTAHGLPTSERVVS